MSLRFLSRRKLLLILMFVSTLVACGKNEPSTNFVNTAQANAQADPTSDAAPVTPEAGSTVLIVGDSLTEGYGVTKEKAFPAVVERRLKAAGHDKTRVINAGISGSTSASGPSRLRWHLKNRPNIVVIALGANDGLRGLPVTQLKKNLETMVRMARDAGAKVILAGMKMPPNYGPQYTRDYERAFRDVATSFKVEFIPFLLEGVGGNPTLNISDGIHPNEQGHEAIARLVSPVIEKLL